MTTPAVRVSYPAAGIVNITAEVEGIRVKRGMFFDAGSGRFRLLSAEGQLRLNTSEGAFDRTGGYAVEADYDAPLDLQYSVDNHVRWRGTSLARPIIRLHNAPPLMWKLVGRSWQDLRKNFFWLQPNTISTLHDVFPAMLAEAGALPGASRFPLGARVKGVRSLGTLATTLNELALATGTAPGEGNDGTLALFDLADRGNILPLVAGQEVVSRASTIERLPVYAPRMVQLSGQLVVDEAATAIISVTTYSAAEKRVFAEYVWPDDVADILWLEPTAEWTTDPGQPDLVTVTPNTFSGHTSIIDGRTVTFVWVNVSADLDDEYRVDFNGVINRLISKNGRLLHKANPPDTAEIIQMEPWLDLENPLFTYDSQGYYTGMINSTMIIAKLRIILDTPEKAAANWQPGFWARFKAEGFLLTALVMNLTDEWNTDSPPFVDIECLVLTITVVNTAGVDVIVTPDGVYLPEPEPTEPPPPLIPGLQHTPASISFSSLSISDGIPEGIVVYATLVNHPRVAARELSISDGIPEGIVVYATLVNHPRVAARELSISDGIPEGIAVY